MNIDGPVLKDLLLWATTASAQLFQLVDHESFTVRFSELSDVKGNAASEMTSTSGIEPHRFRRTHLTIIYKENTSVES